MRRVLYLRASNSKPDVRERTASGDCRLRLDVRGAVQGVGFRPFAYRLARSMGLAGVVYNSGEGATVEVEGGVERVEQFRAALVRDLPRPGFVTSVASEWLTASGARDFRIIESKTGPARALVLADQATCPECLDELLDPNDRRYLYPFINCTHCGPRFSIIEKLPYDRGNTTMADFVMCDACQREYDDPESRRYHAQPNACPECGPHVRLLDRAGEPLAQSGIAIDMSVAALRRGEIIAVKGIGGFHLLVDARNDEAIARLRERKARTLKPFAIMVPSLEFARAICELDERETCLLLSAEAPIVLAARRIGSFAHVAETVAPWNPDLGVMLPYAPLHHILLHEFDGVVVATSGNLAEEPICTGEEEALARLSGIADLFLVHDRRIARPADDSIVRVMAGQDVVLRRGRGYSPVPVLHNVDCAPSLAVGGHLKNALAVVVGGDLLLSQHIGDLESPVARAHQKRTADDLLSLFSEPVQNIFCDLHPDYASTVLADDLARDRGRAAHRVQHHAAHLWACMADNRVEPPCLGVVWDGMGLGEDGTLWGGEFLRADESGVRRVAHLRTFLLVGGDAAARDTRRAALGVLHEAGGLVALDDDTIPTVQALSPAERTIFSAALAGGTHAIRTSSAGRLFDAVSSLLGICHRSDYEGHAASELEFAARCAPANVAPYALRITTPAAGESLIVDWGPAILQLVKEHKAGENVAVSAARFHATLVEAIAQVAVAAGLHTVALTGGCFQNPTLLRDTVRALGGRGIRPVWHRQIPPNDGGLAAGQIVAGVSRAAAMNTTRR